MEQEHIARIKAHLQHPVIDLSGKLDLLSLGGVAPAGAVARHDRFRADASGGGARHAAGRTFRPDQPLSLASADDARHDFAGGKARSGDRFRPETAAPSDEGNLDGTGDRCYADAAVDSGSASRMSKIPPVAKVKAIVLGDHSQRMGSIQAALQLCHALQMALHCRPRLSVFSTASSPRCMPLVMAKVAGVVFQGHGAMAPTALRGTSGTDEQRARRSIRSSCSASPFRRS